MSTTLAAAICVMSNSRITRDLGRGCGTVAGSSLSMLHPTLCMSASAASLLDVEHHRRHEWVQGARLSEVFET
jgi:hypothetical protein